MYSITRQKNGTPLASGAIEMSVFTVCKKDPWLDFIRDAYDAHPMRLPDKRMEPMTLFTAVDKRHRYLGSMADIVASDDWDAPPLFDVDLPPLNRRSSSVIRLDVAIRLINPFLEALLEQSVSLDLEGIAATEVSISLQDTQRQYINPTGLQRALEGKQLRHPLPQDDRWKLYVVDSVLTGRRVVITREGFKGADIGAAIKGQLEGTVSVDALLGGPSSIQMQGTDVPFAFTCFAVDVNKDANILPIFTPVPNRGFAFSSAGSDSEGEIHAIVGETNEFIGFD